MKKSYFRKKVMGVRLMRKFYTSLFVLISVFLFSSLQKISAQNPVKIKSLQKISNISGNLGNILNQGDHFGNSIANIGDLDGDGVADIAVGVPQNDSSVYGDIGGIYILFLKSDHTVKSYKKITITPNAIKGGIFGASIANLGDLNGDGVTDLVVGASLDGPNPASYPGNPTSSTGAVYIVFLKKTGAIRSFTKITSGTTNFTTLLGGASTTSFGTSVAAIGDLDGDGITDIAVGAPGDSYAGSKSGAVYTIFLNKNGTVKGYNKINGSVTPMKGILNFNDNFGNSVAPLGDFDGDGVPDLAVGAFHDGTTYKNGGAFYILTMNTNGSASHEVEVSATVSKALKRGLTDTANFAISLTYLPDINFSPYRAFLAGAHYKNDGGLHRGAAYVVYTNDTGAVYSYQKISDSTAVLNGYINDADFFGSAVANYGNSDTNSTQTVIISTPYADDGITDAGAIYFIGFKKYDVKVDSILFPDDTLCAGASDKIAIVLENKSSVPLSDFSVGLIASNSSASKTFTDTIAATLKPGQKDTFFLSKTFFMSGSGTYKLAAYNKTFGDLNAYNDTAYRSVTILPPLDSIKLGPDTMLCSTESITLDLGNPGARHLWSTGDTTQKLTITSGTPAGTTYTGQAIRGNCSMSGSVTIRYHKSASPNLGPSVTLCYGDSIKIDAGYPDAKHQWFSSAGFIPDTGQVIWIKNNLSTNKSITYTVKISYSRCSYTGTKTINFQHTTVDLGKDTVTICEGTSYTLNAGNGGGSAQFFWNGDTTAGQPNTYTVTSAGTYTVKVTVGGCSASDAITIKTVPVPVEAGWKTYDTLCKSETLVLDAGNPGMIHKWFLNGKSMGLADSITKYTVTNYSKKTGDWYKVVITNTQNGTSCAIADSAFVYYNLVVANLGPDTTVCEGSTYVLKAGFTSPTAQYYWNGVKGSSAYSVTTPGTYQVQIVDGNCYATDEAVVDFVDITAITPFPDNTFLCKSDTLVLDAGNPGATKYEWYKNGKIITGETGETYVVRSKGDYMAKVYNTKKYTTCTVSSNTAHVDQMGIVADLGQDQSVCEGTVVTLDPDKKGINKGLANVSYLWSTGETTPTIKVTGTGIQKYSVEVTQNNCKIDTSVTITYIPAPEVNLGNDTTLCYGDTLHLDAGPGDSTYTYLWSNGTTGQTINVVKKGTYWVEVSNGHCKTRKQVTVNFYPQLIFQLPSKIYLCDSLVKGVTLDPGPADSYLWFPTGQTSRVIRATVPGTYQVTMMNAGGCSIHDSVQILDCPPTEVYIPKGFTPDNDGLNDTFKVYNLNVAEYHMSVYNRWGEEVFHSDDVNKGWDGRYHGEAVPQDVYVYQIIYRLNVSYGTPARKIIKGNVVVIRH
jgi:gliding motility-associated-like protein